MSLIITKYPIVFDVDKFDYSYDSTDLFPGESQDDFDTILDEVGTTYTVTRQTTTEDGSGNVIDVSNSTFDALAYLQHVNIKDRGLLDQGISVSGEYKGYFKHEYVNGGTNVIEEGDLVTNEDGQKLRVTKILGERHFSNDEIIRVATLINTSNEGTP